MTVKYKVVVKRHSDDGVEHEITKNFVPERTAKRIKRGADFNLNHDEFYVELVPDNPIGENDEAQREEA